MSWSPRASSGKKLDLSDRQYQSFDKAWAKIWEREIERGVEIVHGEKSRQKRRDDEPELQKALDESLGFCKEYRKIIEEQDRQLAGKEEELRQLEAMLLERDQRCRGFRKPTGS